MYVSIDGDALFCALLRPRADRMMYQTSMFPFWFRKYDHITHNTCFWIVCPTVWLKNWKLATSRVYKSVSKDGAGLGSSPDRVEVESGVHFQGFFLPSFQKQAGWHQQSMALFVSHAENNSSWSQAYWLFSLSFLPLWYSESARRGQPEICNMWA